MKYRIIKKGDGQFFPQIVSDSGIEFGAWNGYCKTYEEALKQLKERRAEEEKFILDNKKEIVYEEE